MTHCSESRACAQRESLNIPDSAYKDLLVQRVTVSKKGQSQSAQKRLRDDKVHWRLAVYISSGASKAMEESK